ncbi:MAG: hypothetical protein ACK5MI_06575, partial [Mangrovibacterium sp.]
GGMDITLKVDGKIVAEENVPTSIILAFTANDCLDLGSDLGSPVSIDYYDNAPFRFNGEINKTKIEYLK